MRSNQNLKYTCQTIAASIHIQHSLRRGQCKTSSARSEDNFCESDHQAAELARCILGLECLPTPMNSGKTIWSLNNQPLAAEMLRPLIFDSEPKDDRTSNMWQGGLISRLRWDASMTATALVQDVVANIV